jgi:hypothetical protein
MAHPRAVMLHLTMPGPRSASRLPSSVGTQACKARDRRGELDPKLTANRNLRLLVALSHPSCRRLHLRSGGRLGTCLVEHWRHCPSYILVSWPVVSIDSTRPRRGSNASGKLSGGMTGVTKIFVLLHGRKESMSMPIFSPEVLPPYEPHVVG